MVGIRLSLNRPIIFSAIALAFVASSPDVWSQNALDVEALKAKLKAAEQLVIARKKELEEFKQKLEAEKKKRAVFDSLKKAGFSLTRGRSGLLMAKGAAFKYLKARDTKSDFGADFNLSWTSRRPFGGNKKGEIKKQELKFQASVEGHISNQTRENEDGLTFRLGVIYDLYKTFGLDGVHSTAMLSHQSDVDFETRKILLQLETTPTMTKWGIGGAIPQPPKAGVENLPSLQFRWRPYIGLDLGRTLKKGKSDEEEDTILRFPTRLKLELLLNFVDSAIGLNQGGLSRTSLYSELKFIYLPLETDETHFLFIGGLNVPITDDVSVGFELKQGEAPPNFKNIKTYGVSFGIKF